MNDWIKTIMGLAPTVATALGTPLAGVAIARNEAVTLTYK
jgi:hypothetical protein